MIPKRILTCFSIQLLTFYLRNERLKWKGGRSKWQVEMVRCPINKKRKSNHLFWKAWLLIVSAVYVIYNKKWIILVFLGVRSPKSSRIRSINSPCWPVWKSKKFKEVLLKMIYYINLNFPLNLSSSSDPTSLSSTTPQKAQFLMPLKPSLQFLSLSNRFHNRQSPTQPKAKNKSKLCKVWLS